MPPASATSSGTQLPAAISGSIHSMHGDARLRPDAQRALRDVGDAVGELLRERFAALADAERRRRP